MKHKLCLALSIVSVAALGFSQRAEAVIINNVDFTVVYTGTALPNASTPAWTQNVSIGGSMSPNTPDAGVLTLNSLSSSSINTYAELAKASGYWDAASLLGTTIEFSMKVDSNATGKWAAHVLFLNGSKIFNFAIYEGGIGTFNGTSLTSTYAMDTVSGFNTYRLTLNGGGLVDVYVNNAPVPVITGYAGYGSNSANVIEWGDASGNAQGSSQWQYVAFTNAGAFAPVPEPSSAALIGATVLGGILLARRGKTLFSPANR